MAEKILERHARSIASLNLIPSSGGVFEVVADGELIFSKRALGRFPEPEEVLGKLGRSAV